MATRWQMNRMGFIGFWKYDDEIFRFSPSNVRCAMATMAKGSSVPMAA